MNNYGVPHKRWIVLKITRLRSNFFVLFFTEKVNKRIIKAYIDICDRITVRKFLNIHCPKNSTTTGAQFRVKATADCGTSNVVYLIECRRCAFQYVGETENALRVRLTGHRSDLKAPKNWEARGQTFLPTGPLYGRFKNNGNREDPQGGWWISQTEGKPLDWDDPIANTRRPEPQSVTMPPSDHSLSEAGSALKGN